MGNEDPELPLLQSISSLELPGSEIAAKINASQSSSNRHILISAVQRRLRQPGLHGLIAAKIPLLKDTKRETCFALTIDWWKSVLCSDESKFENFGSNHCVFVRYRVGKQIISACVVPTVKHGGGSVMVLCW